MNIENLVPAEFSRGVTPFILGDVVCNKQQYELIIDTPEKLADMNSNLFCEMFFVLFYAPRSHDTCTQPVGDDVCIDAMIINGHAIKNSKAGACYWGKNSTISTWKLNLPSLWSAWRTEVLKNENHHIDLETKALEDVGPTARETAAVKTLIGMGYLYRGGEQWAPPIGEVPENITTNTSPLELYLKELGFQLHVFVPHTTAVCPGKRSIDENPHQKYKAPGAYRA